MGIEGGSGFTKAVSPPFDPQSAQSSGKIISKPIPYPMEEYTSTPVSPYFVQSSPNNYGLDRRQEIQSVNAATADLDQILHASVLTPNGDTKAWSSTLSPSTPHSRGAQSSEPSFGARDHPKATIPMSPLSFISNFRDSIIPASYVRTGVLEVESGTGGGRDRGAARRSSTTVAIPGRDMMHYGGRDGRGDLNL